MPHNSNCSLWLQGVIIIFQTRMKELREAAGYKSQQAFADAFGVAQSTVGGWEAGKREPNYETTIRLALFFNVSIDYLLGYDEQKVQPPTDIDEGLLNQGLIDRLSSLTPEEQSKVDAFVQGMIASRTNKVSPPT